MWSVDPDTDPNLTKTVCFLPRHLQHYAYKKKKHFASKVLRGAHLDAESEVGRRSVQFAAVHHRVDVQTFQVSHVLQVSRFLLRQTRLKTSAGVRPSGSDSNTVTPAVWPLRSLWWRSRDQSGGGKNRPSSRTYDWVPWDEGNPESLDKLQTSAGSTQNIILHQSFMFSFNFTSCPPLQLLLPVWAWMVSPLWWRQRCRRACTLGRRAGRGLRARLVKLDIHSK